MSTFSWVFLWVVWIALWVIPAAIIIGVLYGVYRLVRTLA